MPCYLVIDGKKQEMDENNWKHLWPDGWSAASAHNPRPSNANIHKIATRRNLWQETQRPKLLLKLSQNIINRNYQPLSRVPTVDGRFRPNPIYPNIVKPTFVWRRDASVERCVKTPYDTFRSKGFSVQHFLNNNFYWEAFYVEFQPQSQKIQQATYTQKLLKDLPP